MQESDFSDLFNNFLIGCSCIIGTCSWFARSLSLPVSHSIVLSCRRLFLCIHEMMVIFHDHSDIKSSAPPLRQCRSFYSSYFLWGNYFLSLRLTLLVCSHFRSIIPIKFFFFSRPTIKEEQELATFKHIWMNLALHIFLAVYQSVLVVSLKEWEKRQMRDP